MSLKPPVITQDQLVEQTQHMSAQQSQLEHTLELLQHKLQAIEKSLNENDALKNKVQELMTASMGHFQDEWKRRTDFYPEIRLKLIEKALELIAPAAPKK